MYVSMYVCMCVCVCVCVCIHTHLCFQFSIRCITFNMFCFQVDRYIIHTLWVFTYTLCTSNHSIQLHTLFRFIYFKIYPHARTHTILNLLYSVLLQKKNYDIHSNTTTSQASFSNIIHLHHSCTYTWLSTLGCPHHDFSSQHIWNQSILFIFKCTNYFHNNSYQFILLDY